MRSAKMGLLLVLLLGVMVLGACGGGDDNDTDDQSSTDDQSNSDDGSSDDTNTDDTNTDDTATDDASTEEDTDTDSGDGSYVDPFASMDCDTYTADRTTYYCEAAVCDLKTYYDTQSSTCADDPTDDCIKHMNCVIAFSECYEEYCPSDMTNMLACSGTYNSCWE